MAFAAEDFHDLVRLLVEHPDWRAELRRLVLSEELLTLPDLVRDLAREVGELALAQRRTEEQVAALVEVQRRAEERLGRVEERLGRVEERLERVEERVERVEEGQARLEAAMAALAEAQQRTDQQLAALTEAQGRTEKELAALAEAQRHTEQRVGDLTGWNLVSRFRERAPAYVRTLVRRARVLLPHEMAHLVEDGEERGVLSEAEANDVLEADAVVAGQSRKTGEPVHAVVEVSAVVDRRDVERAQRRAQVWAKLHPALPLAFGKKVTAGAQQVAQKLGVAVLRDGSLLVETEERG